MNAAVTYPGVSNAWTMPIKGRVDMLTTGIRTPVGLKISGADVAEIEKIGTAIEAALARRAAARAMCSPSAPAAGSSSTSSGTATRLRATA